VNLTGTCEVTVVEGCRAEVLPPYSIRYTKRQSQMQTSGYFPHGDEIHACVSSPAFRKTKTADAFESQPRAGERRAVFVDEQTVEVGACSLQDVLVDILANEALTVYPETSNYSSPFEVRERASTFEETGVSRSDGRDVDGDRLVAKRTLANGGELPEVYRSDSNGSDGRDGHGEANSDGERHTHGGRTGRGPGGGQA